MNYGMRKQLQAIRKRTQNWTDTIPKKGKTLLTRLTNKRIRQLQRKDEKNG